MSEQELKALIRTRSSIKSRLTSFKKYIEKLIEPVESSEDIDETEDQGSFEEQVKQKAIFNESYFSIVSKAKKFIADSRPAKAESFSQVDCDSVYSIHAHHTGRETYRDVGVKLLKIKLPCFDGSYNNWSVFYDTFQSLIHTNNKISDIEKFHYLRGALKDDAAKVIQYLEVSAVNYQSAWLLLERRYKNKALMIHNHIKGIVGYPKITKESMHAIRQLSDTIQGHLRALRALEEPVDHWDSLLIFLISEKFDTNTEKEWELELLKRTDSPTQTTLLDFLENRCHFLEKIEKKIDVVNQLQGSRSHGGKTHSKFSHASTQRLVCSLCKEQHVLFSCKSFLELSVTDRIAKVKQLKLCFNYLRMSLMSTECKGSHYRKCNKAQNALLHIEKSVQLSSQDKEKVVSQDLDVQNKPISYNSIANHARSDDNVYKMLATAVVLILDSNQRKHNCVALLDGGSQSNFMITDLCRRLNLPVSKVNIPVIGINRSKTKIVESTVTTIRSKHGPYTATMSFLLLPKITDNLPSESISSNLLDLPNNIALADPEFYKSKGIDILLGVDVFWDLIRSERINHPHLYKTQLGCVVVSQIPRDRQVKTHTLCNVSTADVSNQLARFWEIEDCSQVNELSIEEQACEDHFTRTLKRNNDGRFIVSMPLKGALSSLGDSKEQAEKCFLSLERKLKSNKSLSDKYNEFMRQYENLGHMVEVDDSDTTVSTYYMPHHGVLKENSLTTKLRVVFDASAPSDNGVSLNDLQMVGATIQQDLLSIILRFRTYPYAMSADISMMYCQVLMAPEYRSLQRILWRTNPMNPIRTFELQTVTYGIASSSFLAIRCLFELANECESLYPKIAQVIRKSMYVDDLLCRAHSIQKASQICHDNANS